MSQKHNMAGEQGLTYESAMAELQEIISGLETSEVGIDDLTEKIVRAKELGTFCREKLRKTDEDVKKLLGAEGSD
jgi:exodeoxyribonuclease VII small subunit